MSETVRAVPSTPDVPMIGGAALAAWFRAYAARADRGEIRAAAVAVVGIDRTIGTAWFDESACAFELTAAVSLLTHRLVKSLDGQ